MLKKNDKWLWGIAGAVVALAAYRVHQAHVACASGVLVQTWSWPFYACEMGSVGLVNPTLPSAQEAR